LKKVLLKTLIVSILVLLLPFILTLLIKEHHSFDSLETMDFTIFYELNGSKNELSFQEYLIGVVAANMPAGYHMEALKAQAVIARTYAYYNISLLREEASNKDTFATSELGLSYIDLSVLEQFWGSDNYKEYFAKMENAVSKTDGEVLIYDKDLILPVFFDTSSGYTRNASEAWGITIPYLVSVSSQQDMNSTSYLKIYEFELPELVTQLEKYYSDLALTANNFFDQVTVSARDSVGYVTKIDLGSQTVSGEEFAKVLGLSSNHFYLENYEGKVRVICNGSGHGIGLSQYGADVMAEDGSDYADILTYYYTGTDLASLNN